MPNDDIRGGIPAHQRWPLIVAFSQRLSARSEARKARQAENSLAPIRVQAEVGEPVDARGGGRKEKAARRPDSRLRGSSPRPQLEGQRPPTTPGWKHIEEQMREER